MIMTKTECSERMQKSGDSAKNRGHGKGQNLRSRRQSKAILKIKSACRSEHTIKASFKDNEGNEVKEYVHTFHDGHPPELLIEFEKQLFTLGNRYNLFENGRWKVLCQIRGDTRWLSMTNSRRECKNSTRNIFEVRRSITRRMPCHF